MRIATLCELSILEFWELTPFEFSLVVNSYFERKEAEADDKLALAYINAAWTVQFLGNNKPKLDDFIKKNKKEMTDDEMLKQVMILNNMLGGEIVGSKEPPN